GLDVLLEVVLRFAQNLLAQERLLVVPGVHEVVIVALLIEVLHLPLVDVRLAHLVAALEGGLQYPARQETLDAGPHERRALSRLHVLELDDLVGLSVDLDLQALPELGRIDDTGHGRCPLPRGGPAGKGLRGADGSGACYSSARMRGATIRSAYR